jgi:hypothetical protein
MANGKRDTPVDKGGDFPGRKVASSHPPSLRACCGWTDEAPHGSSKQECNQDGSSHSHVGTQQCGRTPHRGGQHCQYVMQGRTGHAVGLARGGGKEAPHEDVVEMRREDQSPKLRKEGLSGTGGP